MPLTLPQGRQGLLMSVVYSRPGGVLGRSLASSSHELFGVLLGGFAGFGIAELGALRVKLKELENELAALRKFAAFQSRPAGEGQRATAAQGTATQPTSARSTAATSAPAPTSPAGSGEAGTA